MPTQMTPAQARVINPVLSNVARGYSHPDAVGMALFPEVPVDQRGGKIITFSPEDFELYSTARVPGEDIREAQFGHSGSDYVLEQFALEGKVPIENMEDAEAVPGINLGSRAVQMVQNIIRLRLEKAQADLATTAGNYDSDHKLTSLTGTALWSDLANGKPVGAIEAAKEAIRQTTGRYPNVAICGPKVYAALKQSAEVVARLSYPGSGVSVINQQALQQLFEIDQILVGKAIYRDTSGAFVDVWGKSMVLAYVDVTPLAAMGSPSFGYTYRLRNYPLVETPRYDNKKRSWMYPVVDEVKPVIAGATAGYLISPAVA